MSEKKTIKSKKSPTKVSASKSSKTASKKVTAPAKKVSAKKAAPTKVAAVVKKEMVSAAPKPEKAPAKSAPSLLVRLKTAGVRVFNRDTQKAEKAKLHNYLLASSGIFAFFAVMTIVLGKKSIYGTDSLYYIVRDPLGMDPSQLVLAVKDFWTFNIGFMAAVLFAVSAVTAVLLATKLRSRHEATLKSNTSPLRWIYAGVSSVILIQVVNALAGVTDMSAVKLSAGLLVIAAALGYVSEQANESSNKPRKFEFYIALYAGILAFLPSLFALIGTFYYGVEYLAWYAYAAFALAGMTYVVFALNHYKQITVGGKFVNYERRYFAIDLVSKTVLYAIIVLALYK